MVDTATVLRSITERLAGVQDMGNGILRGERRYDGKTFATAYIDLSDHVVERAEDLTNFQERLLGSDFFKADGDQRWNSYLYFWAGPNSRQDANFTKAKARIESDRHFARKFVLSEEDLLGRLEDVNSRAPASHVSDDASVRWGELLLEASLGVVLEQRPRTQLLELIGTGEAFVADANPITRAASTRNGDPLGTSLLRHFHIGRFRSAINDRDFSFGDVNLIFGQNGSGKTSLLESIEAFYCGRIRRDPNAVFHDIEGEVLTPTGTLVKVKSTTTAATIKARNLAWYGRSNQQSSAISHSFTRFNFLDTDAAFRLSSETNAEQIKEDLSLLLVGAEASTLWTYLTKLCDETLSKGAGLGERVPILLRQTELLGNEVKRLQESPTESTALAKTYRSGLRELGATWSLGEDTAPVNPTDRAQLESLSRGFRQAVAIAQSAPTTIRLLKDHSLLLATALDTLQSVTGEYETARIELAASDMLAREQQASLDALQHWATYCEIGAPALATSLEYAQAATAAARGAIGGVSAEEVRDLPVEYASRPIVDAMQAATANLQLAVQQERSGTDSLQQRERLGQSIAALRRDLRDVVVSVIDRTGDAMHCPVCGTPHNDGELLHKIEALAASEDPSVTQGLRQAVQTSREHAQRERDALTSLKALERYATASSSLGTMTAGDLRNQLMTKHQEFIALNEELARLQTSTESLSRIGIDWNQYAAIRNAAAIVIGTGQDVASLDIVNRCMASLHTDADTAREACSRLRELLAELTNRAASAAGAMGKPGASPSELTTAVERASGLLKTSLDFIQNATQLIKLQDDQPLEAIQLALDEAIGAFDRAQHAERNKVTARTDLSKKTKELQQATEQLGDLSSRRENFRKVGDILLNITQNHSLEKATQDALESIRGHVSDIFARIHAPAEYVLGNFQGEALLTTRDGQNPHGVHQVSTGQRAALALSIFLALNRSAESAPPVMLIDDPVAHIDDLNALSFLDYLRDLAVGTRKQIFFATADAKFAALFQRKFEFLGEERFKKIVLAR